MSDDLSTQPTKKELPWSRIGELTKYTEALSRMIEGSEFLTAGAMEYFYEGSSPKSAIGIIRELPNSLGLYRARIQDSNGRTYQGDLSTYSDSQSENLVAAYIEQPIPARTDAEVARDPSVEINDRIDALHQWVMSNDPNAALFVSQQLDTQQSSLAWLEANILASDVVRFSDPDIQRQVGLNLLRLATDLRAGNRPISPSTIWCAIHRGGSLIPAADCAILENFLSGQDRLDTRLVALQTIVRIFEAETESHTVVTQNLVAKIERIVRAHLTMEVFAAGEIAAIVIQGLLSLALLAPERFKAVANDVNPMPPPWFRRQLRIGIDDLTGPLADRIRPAIINENILQ